MAYPGVSPSLVRDLGLTASALTVEKLKFVLRHTNMQVSGNKGVLIERIRDELNRLANNNDTPNFERLRMLIQNPHDPPPAPVTNASSPFGVGTSFKFGSHTVGRPTSAAFGSPSLPFGASPSSEMRFKESPFHEVLQKVSPRFELDVRENTRDSTNFNFRIRADIQERLRRDKKLRILLYCATDDAFRGPVNIAFPNAFELRINDQEVKANFRGLKNKPGTTRPVDITSLVQQYSEGDNRVNTTWALTTRRFSMVFQLVRQNDAEDLVRKLRAAKSISKASVLQEMNRWANDSDIVATSSRMSLKCPLSTLRIQTPCRSKRCRHNQCFDALSFLQLQEQAPQWTCPVCNQTVPFDILQVDEYVDDILKSSLNDTEQVTVYPDGTWTLVAENQDEDTAARTQIKREETELSDDIIEISGPPGKPGSTSTIAAQTSASGSAQASSEPMSIQSSRQAPQKRSAPIVIDLTSDTDDEDLPIRPPAKRQQLAGASNPLWSQGFTQQVQTHSNRVAFPMPPQRPRGSLPSDHNSFR